MNACDKCGLRHGGGRRCHYDELLEALAGVELTPEEQRYLRWLSGWDDETTTVFAGLFARLRRTDEGKRDVSGRRTN